LKTLKVIALVAMVQVAVIALTAFFILMVRYEVRKNAPPLHPPIAPTSSWKRFSSDEGRFSVFFPGSPESTNIISDASATNVVTHMFYVNPNIQNSFAVGYSDSPMFANAAKLLKPQEFLKKSECLCVSNAQGKIVYDEESKFKDYPAREFEFVAGGKANYSTRVKYILVGKRVYSIFVVFLTGNPYLQERMEFFNSFKLVEGTNNVPKIAPVQ
jgi:hypothetical protein